MTAARRLLPSLSVALLLVAGLAASEPVVRIGMNEDRLLAPPMEEALRRAYAALGREVQFEALPLRRTILGLQTGELDADHLRVQSYFDQNPFMQKVDVPVLVMYVWAFSRPPCGKTVSIDALVQSKASYQRGAMVIENWLPPAARQPVNHPRELKRSVTQGVSRYALVLSTPGMLTFTSVRDLAGLCHAEQPVLAVPLFHAVHERHADWVPQLRRVLGQMRERGELRAIWERYESSLPTKTGQR